MRYYIDCEFDGHDGALLSIALVTDGRESIHIRVKANALDPWVIDNVVPLLDQHKATTAAWADPNDVGGLIRAFIGKDDCPTIIADSPVDIGRFCRALSTGPDGEWASADYPAMRFEVHNVDCYPTTLEGAVQHNAWWDAMALRAKLAEEAALTAALEAVRGKGAHPFELLRAEIHANPDCAWGWHCNLAVPIMDVTRCTHELSNQAAALIMAQMFDYDITAHPHYGYGKSGVQAYFEARRDADREDTPPPPPSTISEGEA